MTLEDTQVMRIHEGQAETLKPEQFQQVIAHTLETSKHPLRDCAILQVGYRCGLRAMEIAKLNLSDLMDDKGNIREQVTLRKKTTKGHRGGTAYFNHPALLDALNAYLVLKRSTKAMQYQNVFISRKATPFSPSSMSRLVSTLYSNAGYERATNHSGRRSLASNLNKQNVSVYNVSKILRHSSITTTVNHYLSVDKDTLAELVKSVDNM
jgi:integrase/recombinase XerD